VTWFGISNQDVARRVAAIISGPKKFITSLAINHPVRMFVNRSQAAKRPAKNRPKPFLPLGSFVFFLSFLFLLFADHQFHDTNFGKPERTLIIFPTIFRFQLRDTFRTGQHIAGPRQSATPS